MASDPPAHRAVASRIVILVVTWIGLTGLLLGAGELVTHWSVIEQFDRHITSWVVAHRSHAMDETMKLVTWCGSWLAVAVTGGLVLVLVAGHKLPFAVVFLAAAGWLGEVTSVNLVKSLVDRQRPPEVLWLASAHGGSFPSGHAANAVLVFATLGCVWYILTISRAARIAGVVVSVLGVLTVGFSRVELGVHWMTDVVASLFMVAAWLVGIGFLFASSAPFPPSPASRSRTDSGVTKESKRRRGLTGGNAITKIPQSGFASITIPVVQLVPRCVNVDLWQSPKGATGSLNGRKEVRRINCPSQFVSLDPLRTGSFISAKTMEIPCPLRVSSRRRWRRLDQPDRDRRNWWRPSRPPGRWVAAHLDDCWLRRGRG